MPTVLRRSPRFVLSGHVGACTGGSAAPTRPSCAALHVWASTRQRQGWAGAVWSCGVAPLGAELWEGFGDLIDRCQQVTTARLSSTLVTSCCIKHREGQYSSWASDLGATLRPELKACFLLWSVRSYGGLWAVGCCLDVVSSSRSDPFFRWACVCEVCPPPSKLKTDYVRNAVGAAWSSGVIRYEELI